MALRFPKLQLKYPLLITGSLLLLQPLNNIHAAEQYDCQAGPDGGWACDSHEPSKPLPPRPIHTELTRAQQVASNAASGSDEQSGDQQGHAPKHAENKYAYMDWVPRDQLTPEQQKELGAYCPGTFIEPRRPGMYDSEPDADMPTYVSANASRYQQDQQISTLAGDVVIRRGSRQAEADEANLYQQENVGELSGHVKLRDRGTLVIGDKARMQLDSGEAQIDDAQYVIHRGNIHGTAAYVRREVNSIIRLKDGTFTRCAPGDNSGWEISANNITLNPATGQGTATNAVLRAMGVPVLYAPWFHFPLDDRRLSGFLMPSIGTSSDEGLSIVAPYYLNLAPNYDATLYPNLMTKRGLLAEAEFRFLTENSEGKIGGAFIHDQEDERRRQTDFDRNRWMFNLQDRTGFNSRLLGEIDYTSLSDPYYFQDLDTQLDMESHANFLNQRGTLTWRGDSYTAKLDAHAFERADVVDVTPYDMLPQIRIDGTLPFKAPWARGFTYSAEATRFQHDLRNGMYTDRDGFREPWWDSVLQGLARAEGNRYYVEPTYSLALTRNWGYLKPTVSYSQTNYDLDLDGRGKATLADTGETFHSSESRGVGIFSLDGGLFFDRQTTLFGKSARQTLEPRFFYLYVPYKNQDSIPVFDTSEPDFSFASLFRRNRFSGNDRIGDANQLSLALTTRWINDDGSERQRLSFGQIRYFRDRRVQMPLIDYHERDSATSNASPYATEYLYHFNKDWDLASEFNWDPDSHHTTSSGVKLHYQPASDPRKIVNIGYRYNNESVRFDPASGRWSYRPNFGIRGRPNYVEDYYKINQHDLSATWPILPQWNAIGRWQFDYGNDRTLEALGGLEYDSCCWKVRMIGRYWVDYDEVSLNPRRNDEADRGLFVQVILKGLGSVFGGNTESFLDRGIEGFRKRSNEDDFAF